MNYEDLVKRVGWGEEFFFRYEEDGYWISQNADGYYLTRVRDEYSQDFKTSAELFENGRINGKKLVEIWNEVNYVI